MSRYSDIAHDERFAELTRETVPGAQRMREQDPGLPLEYLDFLVQIGYGDVGAGSLMLYGTPLDPDEVYDPETAKDLDGLLLVADDYAGTGYALDPHDWSVVEIESIRHSTERVAANFEEFVRKVVLKNPQP